jgi:hypothetical protein
MSKTKKIQKLDPFALLLVEYQALSPHEEWTLSQELYARYGEWIQQQFKQTGAALLAICDHQVVYASPDRYDFYVEEVIGRVQRERNKPCFILTRPVPIEEMAAWSDLGRGDFYPTLALYVAARSWSEARRAPPQFGPPRR